MSHEDQWTELSQGWLDASYPRRFCPRDERYDPEPEQPIHEGPRPADMTIEELMDQFYGDAHVGNFACRGGAIVPIG